MNEQCDLASRNDYSYWLSTSEAIPQQMTNIHGSDVEKYISRCSVCEADTNMMAFHSQTDEMPTCPKGWGLGDSNLPSWIGYSFVMHTGSGAHGGGQSLSSPGSCLEIHRAAPFIECHGRGSCNYFATTYSFWLTTLEEEEFAGNAPKAFTLEQGNLFSKVSRCAVCQKQLKTVDPSKMISNAGSDYEDYNAAPPAMKDAGGYDEEIYSDYADDSAVYVDSYSPK